MMVSRREDSLKCSFAFARVSVSLDIGYIEDDENRITRINIDPVSCADGDSNTAAVTV